YASPENNSSDLFWAFHPNRAIVPSLPLLLVWPLIVRAWKLGRPEIPSVRLIGALLTWLAEIAASGICSIRPAPKTGVGIRKVTLRAAACDSKSGCASLHPAAPARP